MNNKISSVTGVGLVILIVGIGLFSLTHGTSTIGLDELFQILSGAGNQATRLLVIDFRFPRVILAVLAGFALGVSGAILQSITQNPLADTGLLGINAGAGFSVLIFLGFVETKAYTAFMLPIVALVGALLAVGLILLISLNRRLGLTPVRMILAGIVVGSGLSALTLLLTIKLDPEHYRFVVMWQSGSIWGNSWSFVYALFPWVVVLVSLSLWKHRTYDVFTLGDETAISLGLPVKKERIFSMVIAVTLAAAAISVAGGIGFIGLIAPHIMRKLGHNRYVTLLPLAGLAGGLIVLLSDTVGRLILPVGEIPAGIITAMIGSPYFLYLLLTTKE